jgi:hypothetical protein
VQELAAHPGEQMPGQEVDGEHLERLGVVPFSHLGDRAPSDSIRQPGQDVVGLVLRPKEAPTLLG